MDRKTFIKKTIGALVVAIPAYSILSCSGSDDSQPSSQPQGNSADCAANGTSSSIGTNHGHTLTVSAADVTAGVEKTYDIQGGSPHAHSVTVTAEQFTTLQSNQQVSATSSNDGGHTHSVTISCA